MLVRLFRNFHLSALILVLISCKSATQEPAAGSLDQLQDDRPTETREALRSLYLSFIGQHETGSNRGELPELVLEHLGLAPGMAYCAAWVVFCMDSIGIPHHMNGLARSCCPDERLVDDPQLGDLVSFDWTKNGKIDHTGFFDGHEGDLIRTAEANTSDPDKIQPEGVYIKLRRPGMIKSYARWIE